MLQDGRLRSGDHIMQIGDVNVRGMGSEQVASVLRQSGSHVRLIVARGVSEPSQHRDPNAPVVPTHQLDEHLHHLYNALMAADAQHNPYMFALMQEHMDQLPAEGEYVSAQVHEVRETYFCVILLYRLEICYQGNYRSGTSQRRRSKTQSLWQDPPTQSPSHSQH